ncbi:methyltransferase family protein [Geodermatophilus tzadiensis]|uniref:Methyltransferase family protein n=1 Tax=Geodermatophilus tzadiensis TaxID=1137988 RepID=A0A2T0TR59_9ACTN|nr:methyltransferase domain-containing protein [Geodermatophilus tzadiensis]PRY48137.1 methyltransferase family protein [Geodermatophilus tzadiensis]
MAPTAALRNLRRRATGVVASRSALARRLSFRLRWSSTRRTDPLSEWGFERGTAVDRHLIDEFLREHRGLVHGRVLEVKEDLYSSDLGAASVEVLDIDPNNPLATIVGDLCDPDTLPEQDFDAAVVTQTLQLVPDPVAAVAHLVRALRPGTAALVTVPSVSRLAGEYDRWRWTALGFQDLVAKAGAEADVRARGNLLACRAFLMGAAVEDLPAGVLDEDDPDYPLLVTAVVRRPATRRSVSPKSDTPGSVVLGVEDGSTGQ